MEYKEYFNLPWDEKLNVLRNSLKELESYSFVEIYREARDLDNPPDWNINVEVCGYKTRVEIKCMDLEEGIIVAADKANRVWHKDYQEREEKIKAARAKLNDEELKLLGLK